MQHRHSDRELYFKEQGESTKKYVLPYIKEAYEQYFELTESLQPGTRVLEVGCGEGGNLSPFLELGCESYGVELSDSNYGNALKFYDKSRFKEHLHLYHNNIYDLTCQDLGGVFEIVFLRDVLEHIHQQEMFMEHIKQFLSPAGVLFIAFPPWRMPFGGHQQICHNKLLCNLPYFHLLPKKIYGKILKTGGVNPQGLLEIKETGISINRFEKIIRKRDYEVIKKTHWFINPNYQVKFGLTPRKLPKLFQITRLQDFYVTAMYYLLKLNTQNINIK